MKRVLLGIWRFCAAPGNFWMLAGCFWLWAAGAGELRGQGLLDPPGSKGAAEGADVASLPREVVDQGRNHRTVVARDASGRVASRYTELISGGFREGPDGKWVECDNEIELLEGGAVARKLTYSAIFAPSSDDPEGVFDVLTPDRKRIRGQCVGLAYTTRDGRSAFFAEMKDVPGVVVGRNEVIYADCFEGIKGSLRYTADFGSFRQDVILESQLPGVVEMGFNEGDAAGITVEIWTELLDAPVPQSTAVQARTKSGEEVTDVLLDMGEMRIGAGSAFPYEEGMEQRNVDLTRRLPIQKEYVEIGKMRFLVEKVPYKDLAPEVAGLGERPQARVDRGKVEKLVAGATGGAAKGRRSRPVALVDSGANRALGSGAKERARNRAKKEERAMAMSRSSPLKRPAYVLDFDLQGGYVTNQVFAADATAYVRGTVFLEGVTTIEGGTCIKFANTNTPQLIVDVTGTLNMTTDAYRPALFTAKDDDSAGSVISGSSGSPGTGLYATTAIGYWPSSPVTIKNARIRNAQQGIYIGNGQGAMLHTISHTTFVNCEKAMVINGSSGHLRNCLFYNSTYAFWSVDADYHGEQVTFNQLGNFHMTFGGVTYAFTNSIFCNAGTLPSMTSDHNVTNNTSSAVFQETGAGKHYLTDTYRNAGTATGINPTLANELKRKTTYPPLVLSNVTLNGPWDFFPVVQRDTDTPDPGWHYDPVDWALSGVLVTNTVVTIRPGTAVATFQNGTATYGLAVGAGGSLQASGTAEQPVKVAQYHCAQEQGSTNWARGASILTSLVLGPGAGVFNFTELYSLADAGSHIYSPANCTAPCAGPNASVFSHSRFYGGGVYLNYTPLQATNCLFDRVILQAYSAPATKFLNCSFDHGSLQALQGQQYGAYYVTNCLFDNVGIVQDTNVFGNYNAYYSGNRLAPNGANDIILSSPMTYTTGTFGGYYQAVTNLVDRGSTSASNLGLYHFTTRSHELKEGNSTVNVGFHLPASDPTAEGLVGLWRLDEGSGTAAADSSGYGHNGTLVNGPSWTSGQIGSGALSFDGNNDYASATESPALRLAGDMTLAFWFKHRALPSGYALMIGKGDSTHRNYFMWQEVSTTRLYFQQWDGINSNFVFLSSTLSTNTWYHAALTESGTSVVLYINGVADVMTTRTLTPPTSGDPVRFGYAGWNSYYAGDLDDVRVYNRALSAGEVAALAAQRGGDSDGDGVPDYLEDANGNGTLDSGETSPGSATDMGLKVLITRPQRGSNIP